MDKNKKYLHKFGVGLLDVILIDNIILKYFNLINWSWWIVFWPLYANILLAAITLIIIYELDQEG